MVTRTMSIALILSVTLAQAGGMEIPSLRPTNLAALRLIHENKSFRVMDAGKSQEVPACWVDKEVRSVSTERLAKMLGHGYLSVNQMSNGEFSVKANVRGEGGGLVLGMAAKWGVRVVGHGGLAVAYYFQPHLLVDAPHLHACVEAAAWSAQCAGTLAPTI